MKALIALGGTALAQRGEALDADVQRRNIARAATAIATIARTHDVVVTHGSSPLIGLLAMQGDAYGRMEPYPLDMLGAESVGMIGHLLECELRSLLPKRHIVTLLTQVEVNRGDAAFRHPSKLIGPRIDEAESIRLANAYDWTMVQDGSHWRRAVASPEPLRFPELPAIRLLIKAGVLTICAGGGGIPVTVSREGKVQGVDAIVDKDLAAGLLAHQVGADALLLLTDVAAVYKHWREADAVALRETTVAELHGIDFAAGSMKPKVEAACRFIESGGSYAGIGTLEDAAAILLGQRGTLIRKPEAGLDFTEDDGGLKIV